MAPEFISGETEEITSSSDIWSLGCTVVELLTGRPPLFDFGPMVAAFQLIEGESSPIPSECSDIVQDFLSRCFQIDPNNRETASQLLTHPWITGTSSLSTIRVRWFNENI